MKAVMYGGGNIGRGFIGMLFSESGYQVTFIDVADVVVNALNQEHKYPVRIVSSEGYEDIEVQNVIAVNGNDAEAAADAIAQADIMATAVGVNVLKFIIPNLTAGIRKRRKQGGGPLNIIICENLMDADKIVRVMLKAELEPEEQEWFDENIGLVEASIGRMVPVQTEEMKDGNPLRVCVEKYGYLPVDKAAFKGEIPKIKNMIPYDPFDFFIKRKLYIHNMGHAVCAYLGLYTEQNYIYESIRDSSVQFIVLNAMLESALALSKKYQISMEDLLKHLQDLLYRFTNQALKDTCKRVGGDPKRKLSPADRLIGSSSLCLDMDVAPVFISIGTAGAVYQYLKENEQPQSVEAAREVLKTISGLEDNHPLYEYIVPFYQIYMEGGSVEDMKKLAEVTRKKQLKDVV